VGAGELINDWSVLNHVKISDPARFVGASSKALKARFTPGYYLSALFSAPSSSFNHHESFVVRKI
jgi:hypothetical protein